EIENDADRPRDAVLRPAVLPRAVIHRDLGDGHTLLARDRRQKPVHLAVQLQRFHYVRAKRLQRAPVVVQPDAGGDRDHLVGDDRRHAAREERILPLLAPPADDVIAALEQIDERRDVARIVLQIAVGGDDDAAARMVEAGGKRRRLTEVAAEADDAQARIAG